MTTPLSLNPRVRSPALVVVGLLTIACMVGPPAQAKSPWTAEFDLEPSLRSAVLVMAVRVEDVSEVSVVYGGKVSETLHQYTFQPVRVLKGVYSRPRLVMTNVDLQSWGRSIDPNDIQSGQQRLLILGRSNAGYVGAHPGSNADQALPRLDGTGDPLLSAAEVLLSQQELYDRLEIVARLSSALREARGRGAAVLLAALERRALVAAQHPAAFQAVSHQLEADDAAVREAAAHVLGSLLDADYLGDRTARETAVDDLVRSLQKTPTPLASRLAAYGALASVPDAVRTNKDALRLAELDQSYDTLAELASRLDILGVLHEDQGSDAAEAVSDLLADLPLDAPASLQQSALQAWARIAGTNGALRLLERMRAKKALGLDGVAEVESFGLVLPKTDDPWPLQRALLETGLTAAEQLAFVKASERSPSPQLVAALSGMLDPRLQRLRRLALDLLMKIDTKAAAEAVQTQLANEPDLAYKLQLAAFLGDHGFDDGYPYALEHMSDRRYLEAAVAAIGKIDKPGSAGRLLEVYRESNDPAWRKAAVRALGLLDHAAFEDELIALTRDLNHALAPAALQARADMGDTTVVGILPAAFSSRSEEMLVAAARSAAKLLSGARAQDSRLTGDIRVALATLARDPESAPSVRGAALEALVAAHDPGLDDVLIALVRDVRIERLDLLVRVRELLRARSVKM